MACCVTGVRREKLNNSCRDGKLAGPSLQRPIGGLGHEQQVVVRCHRRVRTSSSSPYLDIFLYVPLFCFLDIDIHFPLLNRASSITDFQQ